MNGDDQDVLRHKIMLVQLALDIAAQAINEQAMATGMLKGPAKTDAWAKAALSWRRAFGCLVSYVALTEKTSWSKTR